MLEEMPEIDAVLVSHDHYDHWGKVDPKVVELPALAKSRGVISLGIGKLRGKVCGEKR